MADLAGVNGDRKEFKVVGKPNLPGKLSYSLATGMAKFGADYVFPEMLHAKFLRSPYANAEVKSVDIEAAKKIPGVVDVVTWEDPDLMNFGRQGGMMMGPPQAYVDTVADMEDDEVAVIVVAETEDLCDEALEALNPKWEIRPHIVDILKGRNPDAPLIRPNKGSQGGMMGGGEQNPPPKGNVNFFNSNRGDIEAGFKEADHIIEYDFNMPAFSGHVPNPFASVAYWYDDPRHNPEQQSLHIEGAVWTASQGKNAVGSMYGLPPEKVRQEGYFQGGKYCDWGFRKVQEITPMLSKRTGRPVRMTLSRHEMYDFNMNQRFSRLKVGFKNSGLITAIDDFSIADAGVPPVSTLGTNGDQGYGPYFTTKCLNIKQAMEVVNSNRERCIPAVSTAHLIGIH
jgi:xanthine dehydrogenase molybdenum-binding subunit